MIALFSIDSVCCESESTTSAEKVVHCIEFFRKQVKYKGELIEEKSGKAGIANRGFHSRGGVPGEQR